MSLLGEAEGEDAALGEQGGGPLPQRLVPAHPERAQTEHRHLPRVPVLQSVEPQDLGELADAPGVPPAFLGAEARGRAHGGEDALVSHEVEELCVPDSRVVVVLQLGFASLLEELDRPLHHLARSLVGVRAVELVRVQQDRHGLPLGRRGGSGRPSHTWHGR